MSFYQKAQFIPRKSIPPFLYPGLLYVLGEAGCNALPNKRRVTPTKVRPTLGQSARFAVHRYWIILDNIGYYWMILDI